ncbi:MAG: protein kinase domain-containing protein [Terracidiphilus sp.]
MKTCPVCDTPYPDQHVTCPTDGAMLIASRELVPGHIVRNKYRVVRKIGEGGMGVVYLTEHILLGGQIALKFLGADLSRNPQFIKRFRQEARVAYQLRHPNIVEVSDLDQDEEGNLFIAMEFVPGPSLRTVIHHAEGPLPVVRTLNIARGIAAGLGAAHSRGAIHRDVKPENILIGTDPNGAEHPKVLDFGIVGMTEGVTSASGPASRTHGLLLTPEYAAPEQWRGMPAAELDGRTDLYALGGIMYEMLTGRTPFTARTLEGWMFQHLQAAPDPLDQLRPDLDREYYGLGALVMKLLSREREDRPSSVTAFLAALDSVGRRPTVVEPKPVPLPVPPEPEPEPVPELEPEPEPQPSSSRKFMIFLGALALVIFLAVILVQQSRPMTDAPGFSPSGGSYPVTQAVSIADSTPNAIVHYTTDGTAPTESSPTYTGPLQLLASGTTVRAIAIAEGHKTSNEVSNTYTWMSSVEIPASVQGNYDQGKYLYDHKQYSPALSLFTASCDSGDMRGCNYLGYIYAQGLTGARDTGQARSIWQKACDGGNFSSCASLGTLYQEDNDTVNARKYFQKACDGGLSQGCTLLQDLQ